MENRIISLLEFIQSDISLLKTQQAAFNPMFATLESTLQVVATTAAHTESLQKQLSSTHLGTCSRLNTLSSQLHIVTNPFQKFHTSLNNTPDEIITKIFSWIDSCQVFKFRRLNRLVDGILTTAHFAVLNQTKFDTIIQKELHDSSKKNTTYLGKGFSRAPMAHLPFK